MNFIEEAGGYSYRRDKEEEEEEQEQYNDQELEKIGGEREEDEEDGEEVEAARNNVRSSTIKHQFISNLPSTSYSTTNTTTTSSQHFSYKDFLPRLSQEFTHPSPTIPRPPAEGHLVGLSLGRDTSAGGEGTSSMMAEDVEKEHMFDKVVTPSDVGKLNRLVIPKQHAEKYFPLDGSSNEKGLLLNFEDRNGKPWRFRYSYWNSSQSYVMTKGWSRFVKEKKLDAGDIVSFERGAGEDSRHRLFIDWKRRPTIGTHPDFPMAHHLDFQNVRWGNRLLYSLPPGPPPPPPPFHYYNVPYASHYNQLYARSGVAPYYVRPAPGHLHHHHQHHQFINAGDDVSPMVIDSVPVVQGRTVGKRLRLFGVNMDCPIVPPTSEDDHQHHHHHEGLIPRPPHHSFGSSSSSPSPSPSPSGGSYMMSTHQFPQGAAPSLQMRLPSGGGGGSGNSITQSHELSKKGKSNSLSIDLDL